MADRKGTGQCIMIAYEDFSLKIEPLREDVYPVIVLRSPAGEGRSSFRLPFDPDEIGDILFDLGQTVRSSSRVPLREASPAATRTRPQQIGDQLFNALFAGPVRSLLDRSLGMVGERQHGLRIKLHIDPEHPSLAKLASLPWELMYSKETRDFLNLSRFTPILRYLDVQRPYVPLPLAPPLRILVAISSPSDYHELDLKKECKQIEDSWAKQRGVQVEFMERATILALQDRLAERPYHVLHYMGHGGFERDTGSGVLILEDEEGRGAAVDGNTLGVLLRDVPTLRLVFLNACETARVTKQVGLDPFAGVAAAMVMAGIPAVVAMQFPISDAAAIRFANRFYPLLARGHPVDYAVAEGRRAIRLAESGTMEWATPVLFMRAPEGVIFEVTETPPPEPPPPEPPALDEEWAQRLEELYTAGLSAFWLEDWDRAVRHFQAIADVRPDYEDAVEKLAASQRQARLQALYSQALAAREAEDWPAARAKLEELVAEAPDYKDAAALLEWVTRQDRLADLYVEAQRLRQAEQWQAVINVFAQIQALEPDYPDPEGLLRMAEAEFAEQQRQEELKRLHSRALRAMNAGAWATAQKLLSQLQERDPGFGEADQLLARAEAEIERQEAELAQQAQIAALYDRARELAHDQRWQAALAAMADIQALDPEFPDPEEIAGRAGAEAQRQEQIETLHFQAQAAQEARDWAGAIAALEALVTQAPEFEAAAAELEEARKQQRLAVLYAEAGQQYQAEQWQAALDALARIAALDPDYPDPDGLRSGAQQQLAAQERLSELEALYGRAVRAMDEGHWGEARQLLAQVRETEPGFRETEDLLVKVEAEIERAEAERQQQEQIATLYEQALGLARARQWRGALGKMEEIQALEPDFADPEGIASKAQTQIAKEEAESQRQAELAALYAEAVRLLKTEQYQEALETWGQVQALDPRYRDRKKVQATARKKLAALSKPPTQRRVPTWALAVLGGLVLVAIVVAAVLLGGGPGEGAATPTPAPAAAVAVPSRTPAAAARESSATPAPDTVAAAASATPSLIPLQFRIEVISSSDYAFVTILSPWGPNLVEHQTGETMGRPTRARMEEATVKLEQPIERGEAGDQVGIVEDVTLSGLAEEQDLELQIEKGCLGKVVVLVYNLVTGEPLLVERFSTEKCDAPAYVALDPEVLRTDRPPPAPTQHPGEVAYDQGLSLFSQGEYEQALAQIDKAVALDWETAELYERRALACRQWQYSGGDCSCEQAIADWSRAIERSPGNVDYWRDRGWCYFDQGDYQEAVDDFAKAIELAPQQASAYMGRGIASDRLGNSEQAIADLSKAVELDPENPDTYWHRAVYYGGQGQFDLAITDLTKAIELDPQNAAYWQERGGRHFDLGDYQAAIDDFAEVIELVPQQALAYYWRGTASDALGNSEQAIADLDKAVELEPGDPDAYWFRAVYYGGQGQSDLAIADLTKAIELDPQNARYREERGWRYFDLGDYQAAIDDFGKAIELDPEDPDAYWHRAAYYGNQGQFDLAIADLTKAIALDPQNAQYWRERGWRYRDQGNELAAIDDFDRAIELNSGDCSAFWGRGLTYRDQGDYQTAIDDMGKAIEFCPEDAGLYTSRGYIYFEQLGESDLALSDFDRAIEVQPNDPGLYFDRGYAYERMGDVAAARANYEKYLELTDGDPNADFHDQVQQWLEEHPEEPGPTPAPAPLPGTETIPLSVMADSIPWLPYDKSAVPGSFAYVFNLLKPPFDNRLVRQAFALALNRVHMVGVAESVGLTGSSAATSFTSPDVLGRDLYRQVGLPFDPVRARERLAQAGYPNGDGFPQVTLLFRCTTTGRQEALTSAAIALWHDNLGVNVDQDCVEGYDAYVERLDTDTPAIFYAGWIADYIDPHNFLFDTFHSSNLWARRAHFVSGPYDDLVQEAADLAKDPAARQALYIQAERILCEEEAVIIPIYHFHGSVE